MFSPEVRSKPDKYPTAVLKSPVIVPPPIAEEPIAVVPTAVVALSIDWKPTETLLPFPELFTSSWDLAPIATFLPPVVSVLKADLPIATLPSPVVKASPARAPNRVWLVPVVIASPALTPTATLYPSAPASKVAKARLPTATL